MGPYQNFAVVKFPELMMPDSYKPKRSKPFDLSVVVNDLTEGIYRFSFTESLFSYSDGIMYAETES